jgi:hypothetical protein
LTKTVVLALCTICLGVLPRPCDARAVELDDILRMEDLGRVVFTPDGRTLLFEKQPPYEQAPNIESLSGHARDTSGLGHIYVVEVAQPREPRPLFSPAPRTGYWIGGLSPSGRRLAIYSLSAGKVRAGVFDFATRRLVWFGFTPNYHFLQQRAVWISDEELVYGTLPEGEQPSLIVYAPPIIDRMNGLWRKALNRSEPSVTVLESSVKGIEAAEGYLPGTLQLANTRTGKASVLAAGLFYGLRLSPDGRYLAALKAGGPEQRAVDRPAVGLAERHQLVDFDLARRDAGVTPCPSCNVARLLYDWSVDSSRVIFFAPDVGKELDAGKYYQYEPASAHLQPIAIEGLALGCMDFMAPARAVDIGARIAVYARPATPNADGRYFYGQEECEPGRRANRYDWYLLEPGKAPINLTSSLRSTAPLPVGRTEDALYILVAGRVWRLDGAGGAPRDVIGQPDLRVRRWNERAAVADRSGGRELDFAESAYPLPATRAFFESADRVVSIDLRQSVATSIDKPQPEARMAALSFGASTSPSAGAYLVGGGVRSLLLERAGQPGKAIVIINAHLAAIEDPRQEELSFEREGKRYSTCLKLPADWVAGKRYPAIVEVYPSTPGRCPTAAPPLHFDPWVNSNLFVAHGYIHMRVPTTPDVIDPPGVVGTRSPLVLAALDRAVEAGYVDGERVGLFGFSQGHLSALGVLTETNRFRAAVVGNGIADVAGHYGQIPFFDRMSFVDWNAHGWHNFSRWERPRAGWRGVKPWEDPPAYVANSPYYMADRISTPLLIMQNDLDIFDISQSEEMFSALYRLRKEAQYVTYWGEGHNMNSPANLRDWWRRLFEWYDRHLMH